MNVWFCWLHDDVPPTIPDHFLLHLSCTYHFWFLAVFVSIDFMGDSFRPHSLSSSEIANHNFLISKKNVRKPFLNWYALLLNVVAHRPILSFLRLSFIFGFLSLPYCSLRIKWPNCDGEIKAKAKLQMKKKPTNKIAIIRRLCAKKRSWPNCNVNNQRTFNQCLL